MATTNVLCVFEDVGIPTIGHMEVWISEPVVNGTGQTAPPFYSELKLSPTLGAQIIYDVPQRPSGESWYVVVMVYPVRQDCKKSGAQQFRFYIPEGAAATVDLTSAINLWPAWDEQPVPAGELKIPHISKWYYSGGAEYLPDEQAVIFPTVGATIQSPYIRTDLPKTISCAEDWWYPAGSTINSYGRLLNSTYRDLSGTFIGSNGSAQRVGSVESWEKESSSIVDTGVNNLPSSYFLVVSYTVTAEYGWLNSKMRNPTIAITR